MNEDQSFNPLSEPELTTDEPEAIPPYLAYVGINQAARLAGKGKTQIYNDIKAGRLSWHIEDDKKLLRVSDLDRVYKLKVKNDTTAQNQDEPPNAPLDTTIELAVLRERVNRLESENSDLRQTRERLLDQTHQLTLLLAPPAAPQPVSSAPAERKSFWQRLFS